MGMKPTWWVRNWVFESFCCSKGGLLKAENPSKFPAWDQELSQVLCVRNSPVLHILLTKHPAAFYNPDSACQSINILRAIAEKEAQLRIPHCVKHALILGKEANIPASQSGCITKHSTECWPCKVPLGFPELLPLGHRVTRVSQMHLHNNSYRQNYLPANPNERKKIQRIIRSFLFREPSCFSIQVPSQKKLFSAYLGGNPCTCCSRTLAHFSFTHLPVPAAATRHREIFWGFFKLNLSVFDVLSNKTTLFSYIKMKFCYLVWKNGAW